MTRALVSVSDKAGIVEFCQRLAKLGVQIVSTGGTAKALQAGGVRIVPVETVTGSPELMQGRVKTLHPAIHGAILARRDNADDMAALREQGAAPIDMVVISFYPFEDAVARQAPLEEVMENIDIGGVALIRAAAKNFRGVAAITSPAQYDAVARELETTGRLEDETRLRLAAQAFAHVARYDVVIDQYFRHHLLKDDFPETLNLSFERLQGLRYGENMHQRAAFYRSKPTREPSVVNARQLHGKELSFNNILDTDTALEVVKDFARPTVAIVKHATPCGIASAERIVDAWNSAFACDTVSPFGGVVALNRPVDRATGVELGGLFLEVVAAPAFAPDALALLKEKKNLRLLGVDGLETRGVWGGLQHRSVKGGLLVQDLDIREPDTGSWKLATKLAPSAEQWKSMLFAFKAVRHVRSNSVLFVRGEATVAIGGGQTSRVDAARIAVLKGGEKLRGSVMASDAFFPFRDGVDEAARAGVAAIVQPGGSIRDGEVIQAADEHGIAMVFTGQRAFRH